MAIAFRAVAYEGTGDSNEVTINKPAGTAENDILLAFIEASKYSDSAPTINEPSGWTYVAWQNYGLRKRAFFWKRATSSEPASYTFEQSGTWGYADTKGFIVAYSGCVETGGPIDDYSSVAYNNMSYLLRADDVTTTVNNAMLVALGSFIELSVSWSSAGLNERLDDAGMTAADVIQAVFGNSGVKDGVLNDATDDKHCFLVALAPASNVHELSLATTSSVAIGLQRTTDRTLSTASTVTIGLSRAASVLLSATSSVAPSLVRVTSRGLSVVSAVSASLTRKTAKALSTASTIVIDLATSVTAYVLTARDWLVHTAGWSDPRLLEAVEFWGWLPRTVSRSLVFTATSAPTPTIQRMTSKTLSTASTVVAAVPKKVSRILSAGASSVSITFSKKPVKLLMATSGVTLDLSRAVKKSLSATSATVVSLSRMSRKSLSIIASAVPSLVTRLVYAWRDRRTPCVECAYVVAPTAEAHIYAPIAEVIR